MRLMGRSRGTGRGLATGIGIGLGSGLGAGLGAGLMYMSDPISGRRRRALVRDQFVHWQHRFEAALGRGVRDLEHRTAGRLAELGSGLRRGAVSNELLVERVRSRVGRYVHHARELSVTADAGCVTLHGKVAPFERDRVLAAVRKVPGVCEVRDVMKLAHEDETPPPERTLRERMTPAAQLVAGALGAAGAALLALRALRD